MKEKLFIKIYIKGEHVADQDVSGFAAAQVNEMIRVKKEYGLECSIKRVFIPDSQGKGKV